MQPEQVGHSAMQSEIESPEHLYENVAAKNSKRFYTSKPARLAGYALLAVCSAAFYRVRELAAALILFTALFFVLMAGVLVVWLVERGAHNAALWLEKHMAHIFAHRVVATAPVQAKHIPEHR